MLKLRFLMFCLLISNFTDTLGLDIYKNKPSKVNSSRFFITPYIGFQNYLLINSKISQINDSLRLSFEQGDKERIPIGIKFEDMCCKYWGWGLNANYSYKGLSAFPKYYSNLGYTGPDVIISADNISIEPMLFLKKTFLKKIHLTIGGGIGTYISMFKSSQTKNYSWYKNATPVFYDFAPVATDNIYRNITPIYHLLTSIKNKNFDISLSYSKTLISPIKRFEYQNKIYDFNKIRISTISIFVGYSIGIK